MIRASSFRSLNHANPDTFNTELAFPKLPARPTWHGRGGIDENDPYATFGLEQVPQSLPSDPVLTPRTATHRCAIFEANGMVLKLWGGLDEAAGVHRASWRCGGRVAARCAPPAA